MTLLVSTCNNERVQASAQSTAATSGIMLLLTTCITVQAGAKSTAATSLKFQAEATAHLQNTGVGRTQDAPKYQDKDIEVCHASLSTRLVSSCSQVLEGQDLYCMRTAHHHAGKHLTHDCLSLKPCTPPALTAEHTANSESHLKRLYFELPNGAR